MRQGNGELPRITRFGRHRVVGGDRDFGRIVVSDRHAGDVRGAKTDLGIARRDGVERDGDELVVFQQTVIEDGHVDGRGCLASQDRDRS